MYVLSLSRSWLSADITSVKVADESERDDPLAPPPFPFLHPNRCTFGSIGAGQGKGGDFPISFQPTVHHGRSIVTKVVQLQTNLLTSILPPYRPTALSSRKFPGHSNRPVSSLVPDRACFPLESPCDPAYRAVQRARAGFGKRCEVVILAMMAVVVLEIRVIDQFRTADDDCFPPFMSRLVRQYICWLLSHAPFCKIRYSSFASTPPSFGAYKF